jgi:hypothetical protein
MSKRKQSTIAALLEDKPKRGRPPRAVSRKNVYVALAESQKEEILLMAANFPRGLYRSDIPDMAVNLLATRLDVLRQSVADRNRDIPEGVTDLDSLYLLWDVPLPSYKEEAKWTSIRLSPQQAVQLGRAHGALNALFGANRSAVFSLSFALLQQFLSIDLAGKQYTSLSEVDDWVTRIYL